jgi:hypothetical protein
MEPSGTLAAMSRSGPPSSSGSTSITNSDAESVAQAAGVSDVDVETQRPDNPPREIGGREGPEPTRFGDWEKNGRCIDF